MQKTKNLEHLQLSQYKKATNLNMRWDLYEYCVPKVHIHEHALAGLNLQGTEAILDLGCTDGEVLEKLRKDFFHQGRLVGLDINETIFSEAVAQNPDKEFVVGTADVIPVRSRSFDVVLGFFVMYHLEDIQAGMKEIQRVLKDDGRVVFSTSSTGHLPKHKNFKAAIAKNLGVEAAKQFSGSFNLENAEAQISSHFEIEKTFMYSGDVVLTEAEPYIRFLDTVRDMFHPVPTDRQWEMEMAKIQTQIELEISKNGCYTDAVRRGYFICKKK